MGRERYFNDKCFKYLGSERTKEEARRRAQKHNKPYRVTKYGSGYGKWGTGYDIWILA